MKERSEAKKRVLVVGSTGSLGSRTVDRLLAAGHEVRALTRQGSDLSPLQGKPVTIVEGDLTDRDSLAPAVRGVDVVVTTAQGYARRPTDSLASVDEQGNRNLVDVAAQEKVSRFVFTSILKCDAAVNVPHFYQKKVIEDYLESTGVPFVALRPGAFLGGNLWLRDSFHRGELPGLGPEDVPWTYIHPDDVARSLAVAVDQPKAVGQRIELGTDRPVSRRQLAALFGALSGREFKPAGFGDRAAMARLSPEQVNDFMAMANFFASGKYVADTQRQAEFFPPVPTVESAVRRVLAENGIPEAPARR